ncbi:MAG TPA: hypothetical protein VFS42_09190 [Burkholderiaceae bacterium]|nr:hypothetical protein [Burkholderiaceae bacterium]
MKPPRWMVGMAIAFTTTASYAARPLHTEDAGVIERGACELEPGWMRERARDTPVVRSASTQLACGTRWSTQLGARVGAEHSGDEHVQTVSWVGKTNLRKLTDDTIGVALAYSVDSSRPDGRHFATPSRAIEGVVTVPHFIARHWELHVNAGWERDGGIHQSSTTWGIAIERAKLGPFEWVAETYGDDRGQAWINTGVRWAAFGNTVLVDVAYAERRAGGTARRFGVGLKWAF